jgi:hypothetical protein
MLAFLVATSIYTNSLFEHITKIYHIEWRNGSSFQNTAFYNLFGIDHVLIVLNLNSSKALKMLPIGTMDLLYVIESASQTRKTTVLFCIDHYLACPHISLASTNSIAYKNSSHHHVSKIKKMLHYKN